MSILIKNAEMPRDCYECMAITYVELGGKSEFYCLAKERDMLKVDDYLQSGERPPECPLVEVPTPHGRLIDADELEELFRETITGLMTRTDMRGAYEHMARASAMTIEMINDAPTVIEAEDET